MKKTLILASVLVLTLGLLAGCGCRNSRPAATTEPTALPTTTVAPTENTTVPTTAATNPSTDPTMESGNGPASTEGSMATDTTENTENDVARNRSAIPGGTGTGNGITGSITG